LAIENIFKKYSKGNYEDIEPVLEIENKYFELCNQGGLTYCEKYQGPCYGYDFNSAYPRVMSSNVFTIPVTDGEESYVDLHRQLTTNAKLKYGMYYCQITSTNPDSKKVFAFSKHHVYTHYSIKFAYDNRKQFDFQFAFYDKEDGLNCYIYQDRGLRYGNKIFGQWFKNLSQLRELFPKNKLLKHLLSSAWGHLSKAKSLIRTFEQIQEEKIDVGNDTSAHYRIHKHIVNENSDYYILYNNRDPFHYSVARFKPFLTSYARNRIAKVGLIDVANIVRIHTDAVVFKTPQLMGCIKHIYPEEKTTGILKFVRINQKPIRL
jgi:hypothetical protein